MSSAYGIGRYGLGNYSSSTTEERGSTIAATLTDPASDYNRARNFSGDFAFSFTVPDAAAENYRNGKETIPMPFNIDALPTYVRNLVGSATVTGSFSVSGRAMYETDAGGVMSVAHVIEMDYYIGKHWGEEDVPIDIWRPEDAPASIWTPETISGSPWG